MKKSSQEIKIISLNDQIPILRDQTVQYIINQLNQIHANSYLEIGTAYGYSASVISEVESIKQILSIEFNLDRFKMASELLKGYSKIKLVYGSAFDYLPTHKYDAILIDGPKSHQEQIVERYLDFLNPHGIIFIDNLYLRKIQIIPIDKRTKNQQKLLDKLDKLILYLKTKKDIEFQILDIDDGLGVIKKYA